MGIISAIIVGLIIGACARFVMPGKQNMGIIATTVLGALGALLGSSLTQHFGYHNSNGGFAFVPFIVGVVCACVLIAIYLAVTGRKRV